MMAMQVAAGETDDPQFITLLNALVRGLVKRHTPRELWIIQIDNWFDHKWLRFSYLRPKREKMDDLAIVVFREFRP